MQSLELYFSVNLRGLSANVISQHFWTFKPYNFNERSFKRVRKLIHKRLASMKLHIYVLISFQIDISWTLKWKLISGKICETDDPYIQVSSDLSLLYQWKWPSSGPNAKIPFYTANPESKSFVVNCSSTDPVFWDINLELVRTILTKLFLISMHCSFKSRRTRI